MKKLEIAAILAVLAVLIVTPAAILAYQYGYVPNQSANDVTLIMRAPENGGPTPLVIHVKKGKLVRLHVTSHDVAHGFLIGELGVDGGVIEPGKWKVVEFTPDEAGEFGYTCNIRCSVRHPEVRGKIIVDENVTP